MKHRLQQCLSMILPVLWLAACTTTDVVPILKSDDCGPEPKYPEVVVAAWLNAHCRYTPPNPIRPQELSITEPIRVATVDVQHGRNAGWQIILGPENKAVCNYTDAKYTRMVINHDRVVSVTSDNHLKALIAPPAKKR